MKTSFDTNRPPQSAEAQIDGCFNCFVSMFFSQVKKAWDGSAAQDYNLSLGLTLPRNELRGEPLFR